MTDDERLPDPLAAARALPAGSIVVVRAQQASLRAMLAQNLSQIARERSLLLLIVGDPALADRIGAAGIHLPETEAHRAAHWRARRPHWLIAVAAHSLAACAVAKRGGANAAFLAPAFATESHPGRGGLGAMRAISIARATPLPVYAMGGIDAETALRLADAPFAGLAAIGALIP